MVSRASHYASKKHHSQRELTYVKPKAVNDDSWIQEGMFISRTLATEFDNQWGVAEFANRMGITPKEADRRLRILSKMEFLRMSTQRADGQFIRYVWGMENPDLPVR
jgi:hypothetical protein